MATVNGVNATKVATGPTGDYILPPGMAGGRIQAQFDAYEASGLASGSTINVGALLPLGAIILDIILWNDALGGSVTLDVGDSDSTTRYASALDGNGVTGKRSLDEFAADAGTLNKGPGYQIATQAQRQIQITTGGASATGTILIIVLYAHA